MKRPLVSQQIAPEEIVSKRPTHKSVIKSFAFTKTQQDMLVVQMLQHIQVIFKLSVHKSENIFKRNPVLKRSELIFILPSLAFKP